jgi:hypothetical protein
MVVPAAGRGGVAALTGTDVRVLDAVELHAFCILTCKMINGLVYFIVVQNQ